MNFQQHAAVESPDPALPPGSDAYGGLDRAIFAPALFLASLVIILAGAASLRVPIHQVAGPLQCLLVAILCVSLLRWHPSWTTRGMVLLGLGAGVSAWLALADYSGKLLPGPADVISMHPDNWSYQAFADYLDRYARGRNDGMSMLDEFGSHLQGTRFAAPTLLAFLHDMPVASDVATTRVVFVGGCLVIYFFSLVALGRALTDRANWRMPLLGAFLATAGGWLGDALLMSNNDNLIFAALSPALLALLCARSDRASVRWPVVLAGGLLLGALLDNYPEGLAILGVLCMPLAVAMLWPKPDRQARFTRWTEVFGTGVLGVLLALPYLPIFISFLQNQISDGARAAGAPRPGEGVFVGLVGAHRFPAVFALGDEVTGQSSHLLSNLVPLCLGVLAILGAGALRRRQPWFPWVALPLAGLFCWQSFAAHYDYGTYKVLICASWWIYPAISAGVFFLLARFARPAAWHVVPVLCLIGAVGLQKYENRLLSPPLAQSGRYQAWHDLSSIHFVTGQAPVLLALDDDMDYVWATFYLRDLPLSSWQPKGYLAMPHIAPFLARGAMPPPESCRYVLVSGVHPDAVWHNARFSLLPRSALYLADVRNPVNGIETVDGERFLWLGTQPATFRAVAPQGGAYELRSTQFVLGPSTTGKAGISVEITDAQGAHTVEVGRDTRVLPIFLAPGLNVVNLRCLGTPDPGPHSGDPRELMLGIKGPKLGSPAEP